MAHAFVKILVLLSFVALPPSYACKGVLRLKADWDERLASQSKAISRIRFREGERAARKVTNAEVGAHLEQLAQFILGRVSASEAANSENIFFSGNQVNARVDVSRVLERTAAADSGTFEKWMHGMLSLRLKMERFNDLSFFESIEKLKHAEQVAVFTHATERMQLLAKEKYPNAMRVFLVSELEPLVPGVDVSADLVLYSEGGEFKLPTQASEIHLAGGECDLCQTQTIVDILTASEASHLNFRVNADLSYMADGDGRFRLRQDEMPGQTAQLLLLVEEGLHPLMTDIGYRRATRPVQEPALPHALKYRKLAPNRGPVTTSIIYE